MMKGYKDIVRERERFLDNLKVESKDESLFELEMLLKALDRFFNLDNLPLSNIEEAVSRNFAAELRIVRFGIERAVFLSKSLLPSEYSSAIYFQSYVERELLQDYARDLLVEKSLGQKTPAEGLSFLCLTLLNISEIIGALILQRHLSYNLFHSVGQILSRGIAMNRWFNPFKLQTFSPRFDRITNPKILRAVNSLKDDEVKRNTSIALLAFFRLLHELQFVRNEAEDKETLKSSLLIFSLVHSEAKALKAYLEKDLPFNLKVGGKPKSEKVIREILSSADSISFQLGMEIKKLFKQVLKESSEIASLLKLRSAIDSAKGVLVNFFHQAIVTLANILDGRIQGKDIFPDYISKFEQSVRLREDIWLFHAILEEAEASLDGRQKDSKPPDVLLKALKDFVSYFQSLGFALVRYSDHEEFQRFFETVNSYSEDDLKNKNKLLDLRRTMHHFQIFLGTTLGHIKNRGELTEAPFDEAHGRELLAQFI